MEDHRIEVQYLFICSRARGGERTGSPDNEQLDRSRNDSTCQIRLYIFILFFEISGLNGPVCFCGIQKLNRSIYLSIAGVELHPVHIVATISIPGVVLHSGTGVVPTVAKSRKGFS